jgi:hypothetical protein
MSWRASFHREQYSAITEIAYLNIKKDKCFGPYGWNAITKAASNRLGSNCSNDARPPTLVPRGSYPPLAAFPLPLAGPGLADSRGSAQRCAATRAHGEDLSKKRKASAKPKKPPTGTARRPRPVRRRKTVERLDWQGIAVSMSYEPNW